MTSYIIRSFVLLQAISQCIVLILFLSPLRATIFLILGLSFPIEPLESMNVTVPGQALNTGKPKGKKRNRKRGTWPDIFYLVKLHAYDSQNYLLFLGQISRRCVSCMHKELLWTPKGGKLLGRIYFFFLLVNINHRSSADREVPQMKYKRQALLPVFVLKGAVAKSFLPFLKIMLLLLKATLWRSLKSTPSPES